MWAGAIGVVASEVTGLLVLRGHGFTAGHGYGALSLSDGTVLRATLGPALYLGLVALLGMGSRRSSGTRRPPSASC